jgi:hypothetical protein
MRSMTLTPMTNRLMEYIEDAYDDEGVPTPIYDGHSTSHPTLETYKDDDDDEGTRIPT